MDANLEMEINWRTLRFKDPALNVLYLESLWSARAYRVMVAAIFGYFALVLIPVVLNDLAPLWQHLEELELSWTWYALPTFAYHFGRTSVTCFSLYAGITCMPIERFVAICTLLMAAQETLQAAVWVSVGLFGCQTLVHPIPDHLTAVAPSECKLLREGTVPMDWISEMLMGPLTIQFVLLRPYPFFLLAPTRFLLVFYAARPYLSPAVQKDFLQYVGVMLFLVCFTVYSQQVRELRFFLVHHKKKVAQDKAMELNQHFVAQVSHDLRGPMQAWESMLHLVESSPMFGQLGDTEAGAAARERARIIRALKSSLEFQRMLVNNSLTHARVAQEGHDELRTPLLEQDAPPQAVAVPPGDKQQAASSGQLEIASTVSPVAETLKSRVATAQPSKNSITNVRKMLNNSRDVLEWFPMGRGGDGVRFEYSVDPSVPEKVIVDMPRVWSCLLNLLSNAKKFTERGEVSARASLAGNSILRIEVSDTGCGVAPADRSRLFTAFSQLQDDMGGLGLGLAGVRYTARALGGDAGYEPRPDGKPGSVFWFEVSFKPLSALSNDACAPLSPTIPTSLPALSEANVVLVDDDAATLLLLRNLFKRAFACQVLACSSVDEALALLCDISAHSDFTIVFSDVQMPTKDGVAFIKELREWEGKFGLPELPVVLLSGESSEDQLERAMSANPSGVLLKPASKAEIEEAIVKYGRFGSTA